MKMFSQTTLILAANNFFHHQNGLIQYILMPASNFTVLLQMACSNKVHLRIVLLYNIKNSLYMKSTLCSAETV